MKSNNKSFIKIVEFNQDVIRWKVKKSFSEYEIGLWTTICSLVTFFTGVIIFNSILTNSRSVYSNLTIPIVLNLLIVFLDATVVSIMFNWQIQDKHFIIPAGELGRKRKQIILLFVLIILLIVIFIYWIPKITTSFVNEIFFVMVVVVVLVVLSIYHLLTVFIAGFTVAMVAGHDTITISYKSKFIKRKKKNIWNKSVNVMYFNELTSLCVKRTEIRKLPYWELILICNEKTFQIITGTKEFLQEYTIELQRILNLPMEIPQS